MSNDEAGDIYDLRKNPMTVVYFKEGEVITIQGKVVHMYSEYSEFQIKDEVVKVYYCDILELKGE